MKRSLPTFLLIGGLVVLLAALGLLQYRWLRQISESESEKAHQRVRQNTERFAMDFNREIQQKQRETVLEYIKKVQDAAQVVAQREGYIAVIDRGSEAAIRIVIYNQPGLDVTDLVVKEFDKQNK